jgi:hypothetical protein
MALLSRGHLGGRGGGGSGPLGPAQGVHGPHEDHQAEKGSHPHQDLLGPRGHPLPGELVVAVEEAVVEVPEKGPLLHLPLDLLLRGLHLLELDPLLQEGGELGVKGPHLLQEGVEAGLVRLGDGPLELFLCRLARLGSEPHALMLP